MVMPKTPQTPHGVSTARFGRYIMKWGHGASDAIARKATITRQELEHAGVNCEILFQWREFYLAESERIPRNPSAAARAELMAHCLELLNC